MFGVTSTTTNTFSTIQDDDLARSLRTDAKAPMEYAEFRLERNPKYGRAVTILPGFKGTPFTGPSCFAHFSHFSEVFLFLLNLGGVPFALEFVQFQFLYSFGPFLSYLFFRDPNSPIQMDYKLYPFQRSFSPRFFLRSIV